MTSAVFGFIRFEAFSRDVDFLLKDALDLTHWLQENNRHVVIAPLEEDFTFEVDEFVLAGAQQHSHQFVGDHRVDLHTHNMRQLVRLLIVCQYFYLELARAVSAHVYIVSFRLT